MTGPSTVDLVFGEQGIRTVFHAIVDCRGPAAVHGYEALMRGPQGFPFEGPMLAFALAKSMRILEELDLRCLETAVAEGPPGRLFLNLHPATAVNVDTDRVLELARRAGREPGDLVLEIVEHQAGTESELIRATTRFRRAGFRIAVDDFGEGTSNLRRLLRIRPEYLKVDRWFVQGCEQDPDRRAVLDATARLGRDLGVEVIAEGVETAAQLDVVRSAGIRLVQGWGLRSVLGEVGSEIDTARPVVGGPTAADPTAQVLGRIDDYDESHLDQLPFGVIQLAPDGTILQYNRYEENLAGFRADRVVGRNFFRDVAPCTDVQEFAGRFRDGVAAGRLHSSFDFVFTFEPPVQVRVTLYLSERTGTTWVFVQERRG